MIAKLDPSNLLAMTSGPGQQRIRFATGRNPQLSVQPVGISANVASGIG